MSDLSVILHGSVHHHQVRQESPQVRDRPLHHSLFTEHVEMNMHLECK